MPIAVAYERHFNTPLLGYPDATNTGWTASPSYEGSLSAYGGADPLTPSDNGTTFTNVDFPGITVGTAADPVSDITFIGCRFRSSWNEGWNIQVHGTNIQFKYCTIEPLNSQIIPVTFANAYQYGIDIRGASSVLAEYCNIYGFGNAFQIEQSSQELPVVVRHCWIHDAGDQANDVFHHDGFLSNNGGPSYITLHHNTISSGGNTNAIALQSVGAAYDHLTITENWLSGFGYTVNLADDWGLDNTNVIFEDNVFSTEIEPRFGPFKNNWAGLASGCSWRRNIWRVPDGAAQGNPADDGKFWMPIGGEVDVNSPGSAVSATDYTG